MFGGSLKKQKKASADFIVQQLAILLGDGSGFGDAIREFIAVAEGDVEVTLKKIQAEFNETHSIAKTFSFKGSLIDEDLIKLLEIVEQKGGRPEMVLSGYRGERLAVKEATRMDMTKLHGMVFYIAVVSIIAIIISSIFSLFVLPTFEDLYISFGGELPALTEFMLAGDGIFVKLIQAVLMVVVIAALLFNKALRHSNSQFFSKPGIFIRLPFMRLVHAKLNRVFLGRYLSLLMRTGLNLDQLVSELLPDKSKMNRVVSDMKIGDAESLARFFFDKNEEKANMIISYKLKTFQNALPELIESLEENVNLAIRNTINTFYGVAITIVFLSVGLLIEAMYSPIFSLGEFII